MPLLLVSCAAIDEQKLVPEQFVTQNLHPYSVDVVTAGGEQDETSIWKVHKYKIDDDTFLRAIEESILKSGVFQSIAERGSGDYHLSVTLIEVTHPDQGLGKFKADVTVITRWTLTTPGEQEPVLETFIESEFSASAFGGAARRRKALEGAVRTNLAEGMRRLSLLDV